MNIKALKQVQRDMEHRPTQVNMGSYFSRTVPRGHDKPGGCGTTGCIAGFAIWRKLKAKNLQQASKIEIKLDDRTEGEKALGLTHTQSHNLFYQENWPLEFRERMVMARTPKQYTEAVIDRITHFIETKGKE